jgi:hypothetical protein
MSRGLRARRFGLVRGRPTPSLPSLLQEYYGGTTATDLGAVAILRLSLPDHDADQLDLNPLRERGS